MNKLLIPFLLLYFVINSCANSETSDTPPYNEPSTYLSITIKGDKSTLEAIKNDVNIQQLSHLEFIELNGNLTLKFSPFFEYELLTAFPELQKLNIAIPVKGAETLDFEYYKFIKDSITDKQDYLNLNNGFVCTKHIKDTTQINSVLKNNLLDFHKNGWKTTKASDSVDLHLYNKKVIDFKVQKLYIDKNNFGLNSIFLQLDKDGTNKFANFTTMNVGVFSLFMFENQILSLPLVNYPILNGNLRIDIDKNTLKQLFEILLFKQYKEKAEILSIEVIPIKSQNEPNK